MFSAISPERPYLFLKTKYSTIAPIYSISRWNRDANKTGQIGYLSFGHALGWDQPSPGHHILRRASIRSRNLHTGSTTYNCHTYAHTLLCFLFRLVPAIDW